MASAGTSRVRLITTYSQFESAMSDSNTLVVILYTVPGCPHCSRFLPEFNSASIGRDVVNVSFYNVNLMSGDGMGVARRNQVSGVPHTAFYSRGRKLGDMRGDSIAEFKKLMQKYLQERTFSGAGYTLGGRPAGGVEAPRAMGDSRDANADALERRAPPGDKVDQLIGMGFPRDRAIAALQRTGNDVEKSADILVGGGSAEDKAWMAGSRMPSEHVNSGAQDGAGRSPGAAKCGVGLGLADHWDNTGARISDIVPYSPAAEVDVFHKGDKIVSIDGVDVRGKRVDEIKPLILGTPGTAVEIGFIPAESLEFGMFGYNYNRDVVLVTLKRALRVETAGAVPRTPERDETPKSKPWFSSVWEDMKAGAEKMTKSMERGFVSAGDKIEEAGSAAGEAASSGWETTKHAAAEAKQSIKETESRAEEALQGATGLKTESALTDQAARDRIRQLEEENRLLRERLEQQLLDDTSGAAAGSRLIEDGANTGQTMLPTTGNVPLPSVQSRNGNGSTTVVHTGGDARTYEASQFNTASSTNASECTIRVRMTDGTLVEKTFASSTTVRQVMAVLYTFRGEWLWSGTFVSKRGCRACGQQKALCFPIRAAVKVIESALPDPTDRVEYTLMLTYPRRIFEEADMDRTLYEASLVPAATLNVTRR